MKRTTYIPHQSDTLSLVIPLYNNALTLQKQLDLCIRVLKSNSRSFEILICDDGSVDVSPSILKRYASRYPFIRIITHGVNQGIPKTIFHLYKEARNDYILLFSLDGDWDPEDIGKLIVAMGGTNADIVVGKRNKSVYSFYRKIVSYGYNVVTRMLFGIDTIDAGSIKLFSRSLFSGKKIISRSMFFEAEMIIRAIRNGAHMVALPVHFYKKPTDRGRGALARSVLESFFDAFRLFFVLKILS